MESIFKPEQNCWQVKKADRVSLLVDGKAYFQALYRAMGSASKSIMIVGWDLHSELHMLRGDETGEKPKTFGRYVDYLARTRGVDVYLLSWDFAMIYTMEREFFPRYKFKWQTHERIHFCLDGEHPVGASQHQKVVVVDDCLAFCGGFDISKWRWDTPEHRLDDELRVDPYGKEYPPFHDVQMMVDGEAAAALGDLVRQRWQWACGDQLPGVESHAAEDPWPADVIPDLTDVDVAIARTFPRYQGREEVREVEKLFLDSIGLARKCIYIENQYLSSYVVGEALEQRLVEENGPEVIIVMPKKTGGWLEQHTMDVLRSRIVRKLKEADHEDRLRIFYPRLARDPETVLMVHAKVMLIDNWFLRIGSANLSNRSLGLDSECDLALEDTTDQEKIRGVIESFRNRLVSEHLGVCAEDIAEQMGKGRTLIEAIETFSEGERTLVPLEAGMDPLVDELVPEGDLLDPEKPIEPEEFLEYLVDSQQRRRYSQMAKIGGMVLLVLCLAAVWRWTPLNEYITVETVTEKAQWLRAQTLSPLLVPLGYLLLGLMSFPVTLLIIATIIVYGPLWGACYALFGAVLSALCMFLLGQKLGRETVRNLSGSLVNRINRKLSESGILAVITFRVVPVAPFSLINLIAGVSAISLKDFVIGSILGLLPGITAIALVADRLAKSLREPELMTFATSAAVVVLAGISLAGLKFWLKKKNRSSQKSGS